MFGGRRSVPPGCSRNSVLLITRLSHERLVSVLVVGSPFREEAAYARESFLSEGDEYGGA